VYERATQADSAYPAAGLALDRAKWWTMISSEVQRTLVKSPPELWAEISDPESLARHLGEFGEIRITRVQPEQKVEWEADAASGTVVIKPSGWGTKVKLTVTRELAEAGSGAEDAVQPDEEQPTAYALEPCAPEQQAKPVDVAEPAPEEAVGLDAEPVAAPPAELRNDGELDAQPELAHELGYEPQLAYEEPENVTEPEPPSELEPEARRGFFARLFGRRRARSAEATPPVLTEFEPVELEEEPQIDGLDESEQARIDQRVRASESMPAAGRPLDTTAADATKAQPQELDEDRTPVASGKAIDASDDPPEENEAVEAPDPAAELALAEELAAAEVTAVLTGVLDRLGAAHHRPFSRA
jgi:hypothetical protein